MEKMSTNTTQDRISALPDPVLVHILSFLDMKQVSKTSILSKRWQCTWTKVPTLTFAYHDFTEREIGKFVVWVNRTLLRCWNTSIEKFKVDFRYLRCFASDVDDWVRFAAEKQVRDLNLRLHSSIEAYSLPKSVCSNSSLTNLSLCGCQVASWRDLHWSSLKSLSIAFMELNSDIIEKILSGSPMLEYLKITHSWGIHHLYITSANPKELVIDSGHVSDIESPMEISAPNIQSLHILGHFRRQFRLMSVSSLLRAKLNFSLDDKDNSGDNEQQQCSYIIQLLLSIHHVGELELGMWCIRALLFLEANALPSPLSCLTRLKLNANVDKHDLPGIISLLKSSPNLEEFVVKKECDDLGFLPCSEFVTQQRNNYWISRMRMENFPLPHHLKTLKFHGFKKLIDFDGFTLTLVQVLLEKAELLGNIVISSTKEGYQMLVMPRVA